VGLTREQRVSRLYGERVEVWTRQGQPVRFAWRNRFYAVWRILDYWLASREWWQQDLPAAWAGEPSEYEFWRVEASPGHRIPPAAYELRRDTATGGWLLARVWDLQRVTGTAVMARLSWAWDFAHLHVASSYSLRYGLAGPAELAARAAELGMPALALTDRDGLYGAVKHAQACADAGIAAVLGADMVLAADGQAQAGSHAGAGSRPSMSSQAGARGRAGAGSAASQDEWLAGPAAPARLHNEGATRITVLAEGRRGWASLCRLVSAAHQAGQRGAPAVTTDLVAAHACGLIVLLGPASDVGRAAAARQPDLAAAALARWRERAEVVIELVDHQTAGETFRAVRLLRLARAAGVPAVLTNAVRYLGPADGPAAQVLDAARQLVPLGRRHRDRHNARAYLASGEEMAQIAARICEVPGSLVPGRIRHHGRASEAAGEAGMASLLAATAGLARRCTLDPAGDLGIGGRFLPETSGDALGLLRARCAEGLDRYFPRARRATAGGGGETAGSRGAMAGRGGQTAGSRGAMAGGGGQTAGSRRATARRRLAHELAIIARTGLASYFLTVADVADRIRDRGIRCSIRGSGAGCLVNYLIGISAIDPVEHGLIMERFLSEGRTTLPDIDLDVESARRLEAYRVIFAAYGEERVACVSMMETYRARSAIRDVGAALRLPPHEVDTLAKAFPHIRAAHITGALSQLPELRASQLAIPQLTAVFQLAERLDGLPRHVAMHPCGVVLSDTTLLDRTPVEPSAEGLPLTQFDKDDVEAAGMIKLDVLGVRMQSAMAHTVAEIERATGERIDLDVIDTHDEPTFELIRSARTLGCFQIESPGQRELVGKLLPRNVGDLIVDISLFRPGPVNSDMITPYLAARHGRRPARYPHPDLVPALAETRGIVVFHEQVLRVIDIMTGCGLSDAELARRRLTTDDGSQQVGEWFGRVARERGYPDEVVDQVWQVLAAFGAFGFCKAHAAAFAIPTYQSAWLKRHYPAAFYAGLLTHDPGMYPKRVIVGDARVAGTAVMPVDVNISADDWRVERAGGDRFGLRAALAEVKGISEAEVAGIVAGQPYTSLRDFWERSGASRPVTERLVLIGAFDGLYPPATGVSRRDLLARVTALDGGRRARLFLSSEPANRGKPGSEMTAARGKPGQGGQLPLDLGGDGFGGLVPAGELRELTPAERVEAELAILGIDLSQHVLTFYSGLIAELRVVQAADLHRCQPGARVLVAGVKVATQTPAIRSGQRIIFATLEDLTGPVDLAFFESVQERCAARVFGSWLLVVRGRLRRAGRSVSVNAAECWDLAALAEIRAARGIGAVRAAMAAGDVPGGRMVPGPPAETSKIILPNGFALSRYAETGGPGGPVTSPPRLLWHASPGSAGGWANTSPRPLTAFPGSNGDSGRQAACIACAKALVTVAWAGKAPEAARLQHPAAPVGCTCPDGLTAARKA
jgi:error-prone DNA polymerase